MGIFSNIASAGKFAVRKSLPVAAGLYSFGKGQEIAENYRNIQDANTRAQGFDIASSATAGLGNIKRASATTDQVSQEQQQQAYQNAIGGGTGGGTGGGGGTPAFQPVVFRGQTYNDIGSYQNALNAAAVEELSRREKDLKLQYDRGILSYDQLGEQIVQNRKSILKSRDQNLNDISGLFSSVGSNAYQSQQGNFEREVGEDYTQASGNLDTQAGNLGRAKEDLGTNYQNQLADAKSNEQANRDSYANYANDIRTQQGALNKQNVGFNPVQLGQSILQGLRASGVDEKQAASYTNTILEEQGIQTFLSPGA